MVLLSYISQLDEFHRDVCLTGFTLASCYVVIGGLTLYKWSTAVGKDGRI